MRSLPLRIAVIGATGVLGRQVVPRLIERGHIVRAGVRDGSESRARTGVLAAVGAELHRADILDGGSLEPFLAGCEAVLHLATAIPKPGAAPDWGPNDRVRREGTGLLLEAARRAGVRCIVAQSIAMLHGGSGERWVAEDDALPPVPPHLRSALDLEAQVRASALDFRILRGALFYGPDTGRDAAWRQAARACTLRLPGDGSGYLSLIRVTDMARAVVVATESSVQRATYLVADDQPATYRELFSFLARAEGVALPEPGAAALLGSFRVSNAKARRELGWEPAYPTYRAGLA